MAKPKVRYDKNGRKARESRTATKAQIMGQDLGRRWSKSFTPEYKEWLARQNAKRRGRRV